MKRAEGNPPPGGEFMTEPLAVTTARRVGAFVDAQLGIAPVPLPDVVLPQAPHEAPADFTRTAAESRRHKPLHEYAELDQQDRNGKLPSIKERRPRTLAKPLASAEQTDDVAGIPAKLPAAAIRLRPAASLTSIQRVGDLYAYPPLTSPSRTQAANDSRHAAPAFTPRQGGGKRDEIVLPADEAPKPPQPAIRPHEPEGDSDIGNEAKAPRKSYMQTLLANMRPVSLLGERSTRQAPTRAPEHAPPAAGARQEQDPNEDAEGDWDEPEIVLPEDQVPEPARSYTPDKARGNERNERSERVTDGRSWTSTFERLLHKADTPRAGHVAAQAQKPEPTAAASDAIVTTPETPRSQPSATPEAAKTEERVEVIVAQALDPEQNPEMKALVQRVYELAALPVAALPRHHTHLNAEASLATHATPLTEQTVVIDAALEQPPIAPELQAAVVELLRNLGVPEPAKDQVRRFVWRVRQEFQALQGPFPVRYWLDEYVRQRLAPVTAAGAVSGVHDWRTVSGLALGRIILSQPIAA